MRTYITRFINVLFCVLTSHHSAALSFASLLFSNEFFKSFLNSSQSLGPYNIVYLYCNFFFTVGQWFVPLCSSPSPWLALKQLKAWFTLPHAQHSAWYIKGTGLNGWWIHIMSGRPSISFPVFSYVFHIINYLKIYLYRLIT